MEREQNVSVVRRMWAAYYKQGLRGILAFAKPDAEWRPYSAHGRVFCGNDEYAAYIDEMERSHQIVEATLVEVHAARDCVVVSGRLRLRGPDGIADNPMHWVHRFEDGQVAFTASYPNLDTALRAAGLDAADRVEQA